MTRVPKARARGKGRSRLSDLRRSPAPVAEFEAAPGPRVLAGILCTVLTAMFAANLTQIGDGHWIFYVVSAVAVVFFAVLGWYFLRRGRRKGLVLRVGPDGFGIAIGFEGWIEFTWDQVEAFRYWEPTGIAMLVKRRQSRWVGIVLRKGIPRGSLTWDERFEVWLNTFHNRPGLCILHPFVRASILDVLQAFKDHAPKELDDYEWMQR